MAKLPRHIQKLKEEGEAAQALLNGEPPAVEPAPVEATPAEPVAPVVAEPAAPVVQAAQDADLQQQIANLTQQLNVLRGKYDGEVPKLSEENRNLRDANKALTEQLQQANQPSVTEAIDRLKEEYSEDIINDLLTLVRSETQPLAQQTQAFGQDAAALKAQTFGTTLAGLVPDHQAINVMPEFAAFVDQPIPFADGETYRQRLLKKHDAKDAYGVAEIFNAFKSTNQAAPQTDTALPIEPGGANRGGGLDPNAGPKVWTGQEIDAAYRKMKHMLPEDKASLKAEIDQAMAEGRVAA